VLTLLLAIMAVLYRLSSVRFGGKGRKDLLPGDLHGEGGAPPPEQGREQDRFAPAAARNAGGV